VVGGLVMSSIIYFLIKKKFLEMTDEDIDNLLLCVDIDTKKKYQIVNVLVVVVIIL
jgi:hypothetical protein